MRERPDLRERPIAIGGSAQARGVISTCNYPARKFGVRSAMATGQALRLCPGLILLPHQMDLYRDVSASMMAIFKDYSELIEPLSVDEAFLDVSAVAQDENRARDIAQSIRARVQAELGITVSAGVAPNKFLAKVASDWRKPDGLFQVRESEVSRFMHDLPVKVIPGVGRVTHQQLQFLGVSTCGQLQGFSREELAEHFGRFGERLYDCSRGIDHRPVKVERERKSVSVERTFAQDLVGQQSCYDQLPELWQRLQPRLARLEGDYRVSKGFVKVKFADFAQTTVERVGTEWDARALQPLLAEALGRGQQKVRLLGVGLRVTPRHQAPEPHQAGLFDN